jgi:putative transposase
MAAYQAFLRTTSVRSELALSSFADLYNGRLLQTPEWVLECIPRITARTLSVWLRLAKSGAVDRLGVDRGAARRGKGIFDEAEGGALRSKILTFIAHQPFLSADHVRTLCRDAFGDTLSYRGQAVPMPSVRAFQMALKQLKIVHKSELLALHNPDKFKSTLRVSGSRAHLVQRLNEQWQIDASPADMLCTDGRHSIYVCVDVWSRRMIVSVSRTPRAEAVGLLIKKALLAWGVPERIKTDNGSDFIARATKRLFASLHIEAETSAAFSPEQKGVVERAIGTLQRDFMPLLPGFIGHSVADRKAIENRKAFSARLGQDDARAFHVDLSAAELSRYLDLLIEDRYNQRAHGGIDKMTPFTKAASYLGQIRLIDDEAALSVLLAPIAGGNGLRTLQKQGLRINGSHYLIPGIMPGETVFVRMDPADLGRAYIFRPDGETFIGLAICPDLAGIDPAAALAAAQAAQKQYIAAHVAPIRKEAAKIKPRDMVDAIVRQAAKDAGNLVEFPPAATPHHTPALTSAREVVEAIHKKYRDVSRAPQREAERVMLAHIEAESAAPITPPNGPPAKVQPLRKQETPHQRFARARAFEGRIRNGETLTTEQALWLGGYQVSAEYRGHQALQENFGPEDFGTALQS